MCLTPLVPVSGSGRGRFTGHRSGGGSERSAALPSGREQHDGGHVEDNERRGEAGHPVTVAPDGNARQFILSLSSRPGGGGRQGMGGTGRAVFAAEPVS